MIDGPASLHCRERKPYALDDTVSPRLLRDDNMNSEDVVLVRE